MNEYIEHKLVVKPGLGSFIVTSDGEEIKFSDCVNRLDYVAYREALKNLEPKKKLENERYGND